MVGENAGPVKTSATRGFFRRVTRSSRSSFIHSFEFSTMYRNWAECCGYGSEQDTQVSYPHGAGISLVKRRDKQVNTYVRKLQILPGGIKEVPGTAFLSLGAIVVLGQSILCFEGAVLCCRVFSNILGLYPLELPSRDNQESPQSWPLGYRIRPWLLRTIDLEEGYRE